MTTGTGPAGRDGGAVTRDRERSWLWVVAGVALVVVVFAVAYTWWTGEAQAADAGATIDEIDADPDAYLGMTVTVSGRVEEVLGERLVRIGGELVDGTLLVASASDAVSPGGREAAFLEGDVVQASGPLRPFDASDVGRVVGADLDAGRFDAYAGDPIVMAERLDFIVLGNPSSSSGRGTGRIDTNLADVVLDSSPYIGHSVDVRGEVSERLDSRSFVVSDPDVPTDAGLLVVGWQPIDELPGELEGGLDEGDVVHIEGVVRVFDIDGFRADLGDDFDEGIYAEFDGGAALVAHHLTALDG